MKNMDNDIIRNQETQHQSWKTRQSDISEEARKLVQAIVIKKYIYKQTY